MKDFLLLKKIIIDRDITDNTPPEIKQSIFILLDFLEYDYFKELEIEEDSVKKCIKNSALNYLVNFKEELDNYNLNFLDDLNYLVKTYKFCPLYFYNSMKDTYDRLKYFKDSGLDETQYYREIESINKSLLIVKNFSSNQVILDKLPEHPTDIINSLKKDAILTFLNYDDNHWKRIDIENYKGEKHKDELLAIIDTVSKYTTNKKYQRSPKPSKQSNQKEKKFNIFMKEFQKYMNHINKDNNFTLKDKELTQIRQKIEKFGFIKILDKEK